MPLQLVQDLEIDALETPPSTTTVGWPVAWSAVLVGALGAVAATVLFGLLSVATGAHQLDANPSAVRPLGWMGVWAAVGSAFVAFVIGGWIAGRLTGSPRHDTGALHGAIAWLVALPVLLFLVAAGAAPLGHWWSGFGQSGVELPPPAVIRNSAAGAVTALLLGLMGSVLGGWLATAQAKVTR